MTNRMTLKKHQSDIKMIRDNKSASITQQVFLQTLFFIQKIIYLRNGEIERIL